MLAAPHPGSHGHGGEVGGSSETDELNRRYRLMELSRKQSREGHANTLRMQRQQIEKLKRDERFEGHLALETRQARQANNMSAIALVEKMLAPRRRAWARAKTERRRLLLPATSTSFDPFAIQAADPEEHG